MRGWMFVLLSGCGLTVPLSPSFEGPPPDPCELVSCEPGLRCVDGACVEEGPCAGVECDPGQTCLDGQCVAEELDQDGDGYPVGVDCDDHDPGVYPGVARACHTDCGDGLRNCLGPRWSDCSAPVDCDCQPGQTRTEDCGRCGEAERVCGPDGHWGRVGPCQGNRDCERGATEQEACGNCGFRNHTCDQDCHWGSWSACQPGGDGCSPGDVEQRDCGPCGLGSSDRLCDDSCVWAPWAVCAVTNDVCVPGQRKEQACDQCSLVSQECAEDCRWADPSECTEDRCQPGASETRACLCGGVVQTRTCLDTGCYGSWDACPDDDRICLEDDGFAVPCEAGCGVALCRGFCMQDCSVPCHCVDPDDNASWCPGDSWVVVDGCGAGVDATTTCLDAAGHCLLETECPAIQ